MTRRRLGDPLFTLLQDVPADILSERGAGAGEPPPKPADAPQQPRGIFVTRYQPGEFPIPGATEFARDAFENSPGVGTITPAGLFYRVPESSLGIIRVFGVGITNMVPTTNVIYRLLVNGKPVPAWGNFRLFPGAGTRITSSVGTWVELTNNDEVSVEIQNIDGGIYQVGANYSGWVWPESLDRQWKGQRYGVQD